MPYEGPIPYDQYGNPLPYVWQSDRVVWYPNTPFHATLLFQRFERGRSSVKAIYRQADDESWEAGMFLSEFESLVSAGHRPYRIAGEFDFVKRGSNYGLHLIALD